MGHLVGAGGTGQETAAAVLRLAYLCGLEYPDITIVDSDLASYPPDSPILTRWQVLTQLQDRLKKIAAAPREIVQLDPSLVSGEGREIRTVPDLFTAPGDSQPCLEDRRLLGLLFDDKQLDISIRTGFHGHPAVGSVVFADGLRRGRLKSVLQEIRSSAATAPPLRLVLVASLTGGVGTAVLPTLLLELNKLRGELDATKRTGTSLQLCGVFQTRWFRLEKHDAGDLRTVSTPPDVTSEMLSRNMACLTHQYIEQMKNAQLDVGVLLGLPEDVPRTSTGGERQPETLHYICLLTGIAAANALGSRSIEQMLRTNLPSVDLPR